MMKKIYGAVLIGVGMIMLFVPVIPGWALIGVGIALGFPTVWQRLRARFHELHLKYKILPKKCPIGRLDQE